jgi:hypothetical protein
MYKDNPTTYYCCISLGSDMRPDYLDFEIMLLASGLWLTNVKINDHELDYMIP